VTTMNMTVSMVSSWVSGFGSTCPSYLSGLVRVRSSHRVTGYPA
jgi:hypothetical protein